MDLQWCARHFLSYKWLSTADALRDSISRKLEVYSIDEDYTLSGDAADVEICRALCNSYFMQIAERVGSGNSFRSKRGPFPTRLHESTVLQLDRPPFLVLYHEYFRFLQKLLTADIRGQIRTAPVRLKLLHRSILHGSREPSCLVACGCTGP
jgi:hypothetical protein